MQRYNAKDGSVKWNSPINEMELEELRTFGSANITFTSTSPPPAPSPATTALMVRFVSISCKGFHYYISIIIIISLPYSIRSSRSVASFKNTLKTFLFQKAFL